jgi:cytochrome c5
MIKVTPAHDAAHSGPARATSTFVEKKRKTLYSFHIKNKKTMRTTTLVFAFLALIVFACTSKTDAEKAAKKSPSPIEAAKEQPETHGTEVKEVALTNPLNTDWVKVGQGIYDMKCLACHKLTGEKLVGPGWMGVTKRREPTWIMNMITNVDMMLEKDPEAQKLLEQCLVRMPNQNLTQEDARKIIEFMRKNDGEK